VLEPSDPIPGTKDPALIFVAQKQGIGHHGLKARVADSRNGFGVVEVHVLRKGVSTGRCSTARFFQEKWG